MSAKADPGKCMSSDDTAPIDIRRRVLIDGEPEKQTASRRNNKIQINKISRLPQNPGT